MNDSKPNTQIQRDVDKILQEDLSNRAQREADAALKDYHPAQEKLSAGELASKHAVEGLEKEVYGQKMQADIKGDAAKFSEQLNRSKQMAEQNRPENKTEAASVTNGESQGVDNDYYNGMSQ